MPFSTQDAPDLKIVLEKEIDIFKERVNVSIPAVIQEFDPEEQVARVKPTIYEMYKDGVTKSMPDIFYVPVIFPSSGGGSLTFPVKKGDEVMLVFSQRAFDQWWVSSKVPSKPTVQRYHDYNDAVAIIGLKSRQNSLKASTENVELRFDDDQGKMINKITMTPEGKFKIENKEEELLSLLSELIQVVANNTTNTIYGPSPMNSKPELEALKTRLDKLKV